MAAIRTKDHLDGLKGITPPYEFSLERIQVVASIREWCEEHGVEPPEAPRIAKVVRNRNTGKYLILVAETVDSENVEAIKSKIRDEGLEDHVAQLITDEDLLKHSILHEIYYGVNDMLGHAITERQCDQWAFEQMGIRSPGK